MSIAINRTTIVRGPAKITWDGQTYYTRDGATLTFTQKLEPTQTDGFGTADRRVMGHEVKVSFTPNGILTGIPALFTCGAAGIGSSLFGVADKALVITSLRETITVKNAAVTKPPTLRFSAGKGIASGAVEFTGLVANNQDAGDPTQYMTVGAGGGAGAPDLAAWVTPPYLCTVGLLPAFPAEQGFEFAATLATVPVQVDGAGVIDHTITDVTAKLTCIPIATTADFFGLAASAGIGSAVASVACSLSPAGTAEGALELAFAAGLASMQAQFAAMKNGRGTLVLDAYRTFTESTMNTLFTLSSGA